MTSACPRALAEAVDRHPDLELISQNLSITVFRYVPAALRGRIGDADAEQRLDAINREVLDRLQRGGEAFVSNAVVADRYALRACIVNYHTSDSRCERIAGDRGACRTSGGATMTTGHPAKFRGGSAKRSHVVGLAVKNFGRVSMASESRAVQNRCCCSEGSLATTLRRTTTSSRRPRP